jgi:hypothetical protein
VAIPEPFDGKKTTNPPVSKPSVAKRPKHPVSKTSGFQNVRFSKRLVAKRPDEGSRSDFRIKCRFGTKHSFYKQMLLLVQLIQCHYDKKIHPDYSTDFSYFLA